MKKILFATLLLISTAQLMAQSYMGLGSENFGGVYSLNYNPAEIVDSRYRVHVNLFSMNLSASNDYIGIKSSVFTPLLNGDTINEDLFRDEYLVERLNGKRKSIYQDLEVGLPSFMLTFGKKTQHAIGFNCRIRQIANANGIEETTARQSFYELELADLYNIEVNNKNLSIQADAWVEWGLSYGREIFNKGEHYLKAAGTMKLTQGLVSAYMYSDNANVTFNSDSSIAINDSDLSFGYSNGLADIHGYNLDNANYGDIMSNLTNRNRFGVGWDFGAVYEYRPKHKEHKYLMNNDSNFINPTTNKYLLKAGFSVMDLGFLNFENFESFDRQFYANVPDIYLDYYFGNSFDDFDSTGLQGFHDTLTSLFQISQNKRQSYLVSMPTRINMYVDYNIYKWFYVSASASLAPGYFRNPEKTRALSEFALIPRFESRWFSLYLPTSINAHNNFHFGVGMRAGPLVIGTNDITPLLGKATIYDANFYMGLNVPIYRSLNDRDRDHVSKKFDECLKEAGTWATKGCADKDNDGITDNLDDCPDVAGIEKFNGCPDTDEDGIMDKEDDCPEEAGLADFKGCPDTDGDGIMDKEDDCPEEAGVADFKGCADTDKDGIMDKEDDCPETPGIADFQGCPDTDGDGLMDSIDDCPETPGIAEFQGCPDTDGDGIMDKEDGCPEEKGPKENKGCPWGDKDGDTVLDKDDKCPDEPGTVANNGCPEIKEEVKEIIKKAFDNLEFETGRAVIRKSSYAALDELAKVMNDYSSARMKIAGHTDNVGKSSENMKLSKDRAEAVRDYFVKKGISADRFTVEAYGDTKPIADNNRSSGRKKNRRVELELTYEK